MAYPANKPWLPIFELFTIDELMVKLDYSRSLLQQVRSGRFPTSPKFRRQAVKVLKRTERELFSKKERTSNAHPLKKNRPGNRHRR